MNSSTRLTFAVLIGGGAGFWASQLFGNVIFLVLLGIAIAVAIETGLQTRRNTKLPSNPALPSQNTSITKGSTPPQGKPPKHTF